MDSTVDDFGCRERKGGMDDHRLSELGW